MIKLNKRRQYLKFRILLSRTGSFMLSHSTWPRTSLTTEAKTSFLTFWSKSLNYWRLPMKIAPGHHHHVPEFSAKACYHGVRVASDEATRVEPFASGLSFSQSIHIKFSHENIKCPHTLIFRQHTLLSAAFGLFEVTGVHVRVHSLYKVNYQLTHGRDMDKEKTPFCLLGAFHVNLLLCY